MLKHDDYENPCGMTITKHKNGFYTLKYISENFEMWGTKDDILNELGEHLDNMKGDNHNE